MRKRLLHSGTGFEKPESREEAIIQNILGASNVLEPSESRIEELLLAILYNTTYNKEPESRIEELLIAIKNNGAYNKTAESREEEILLAILRETEYMKEPESRIEELLIEWLQQRSQIKVFEGVPPLTFTSRGLPLINYLIEGNTVQSGTPTPDSPIMPEGCGERTENLVRFYQEEMQGNFYGVDITLKNAEITLNGTVSSGNGHWIEIGYKFGGGTESTDNVVIPCEPETSYTITTEILDGNSSEVRTISFGTSNTNTNKNIKIGNSLTTMFNADINRIFISLGAGGVVFNNLKFRVMFNKGSTALPYEPYGYKIPISSANTTTSVYLGEVETTRRVKKLMLTGEENWRVNPTPQDSHNVMNTIVNNALRGISPICTHYIGSTAHQWATLAEGHITTSIQSSNYTRLAINVGTESLDDFVSYLAAQYAAGTPVTVWYVLATPETGIVNEPLMKIGDYADSISMEQAGVQIPTTNGSNTLDVDTTLKPSNVYIEYK